MHDWLLNAWSSFGTWEIGMPGIVLLSATGGFAIQFCLVVFRLLRTSGPSFRDRRIEFLKLELWRIERYLERPHKGLALLVCELALGVFCVIGTSMLLFADFILGLVMTLEDSSAFIIDKELIELWKNLDLAIEIGAILLGSLSVFLIFRSIQTFHALVAPDSVISRTEQKIAKLAARASRRSDD